MLYKEPVGSIFSDHTYATKYGVELVLRVWPAQGRSASDPPAPWLFWSHGGAFHGGSHHTPKPWVFPGLVDRGVHVVSYGYRLAPQASIYDMIEDGRDAFDWCRRHLPSLLGAGAIDLNRYAVGGESAGGTLAALNGFALYPRPSVVVAAYGALDFTDPVFDVAPKFEDPFPMSGHYSDTELDAMLDSDRDLSCAVSDSPNVMLTHMPFSDAKQHWQKMVHLDSYPWSERLILQCDLMKRAMGNGKVMSSLTRREYFADRKAWIEEAHRVSPIGRLDALSKEPASAPAYPPTFLIHGEDDGVIPCAQSRVMAEKLRAMGVQVAEAYEPGMPHGFDLKYTGPNVEGWDVYIEPLLQFVHGHLAQHDGIKVNGDSEVRRVNGVNGHK